MGFGVGFGWVWLERVMRDKKAKTAEREREKTREKKKKSTLAIRLHSSCHGVGQVQQQVPQATLSSATNVKCSGLCLIRVQARLVQV